MPSDLRSIDLATLNIARDLVVAALRNQVCLWEQQSSDAVADGQLTSALMLKNWAFAGDLLASIVTSEITGLFTDTLNARFDLNPSSNRSISDQMLDVFSLEVASAQEEPLVPC